MGRKREYKPNLTYGIDMPKFQCRLLSLTYNWEDDVPISSSSLGFKKRFQEVNKNLRNVCFICSKGYQGEDNELMDYKAVFSFNSYLERNLLRHEPKWIKIFTFIRFVFFISK